MIQVPCELILQPLRKRKIGTTSRACFLDESDEETEPEPEVEPQHLSSQSSTPFHRDGATCNAAGTRTYREDTDRSEVCRTSQQECEDLSSEGAKAVADLKEASEEQR